MGGLLPQAKKQALKYLLGQSVVPMALVAERTSAVGTTDYQHLTLVG